MYTTSRRLGISIVAAALLLLKAAMPWLATGAAHASGLELVEVCTVYGVAMVSPGDAPSEHPDEPVTSHQKADHCSLSGLSAWAPSTAMPVVSPSAQCADAPRVTAPECDPHDSSARWIARLKHGPPFLA